jgi:DNA-binding SARP family transcriptional activator
MTCGRRYGDEPDPIIGVMAGTIAGTTGARTTQRTPAGHRNGRATPRARLYLLGGFELRIDGELLDIQPVAQRLLALLALGNRALERSFVAFQLWPDTREERAKANLRSAVWRLRRGSVDVVESSKTQMRLAPWVWVDTCDGLRAADPDARLASPGQHRLDATINAELLPDWYDEWLVPERERIRQLGLHTLEARGNQFLGEGRIDEAIQVGLRAIAMEPLRESPHRLVIRCHLAEGNLVEAVRQYDRYAELIGRELGALPSALICNLLSASTKVG